MLGCEEAGVMVHALDGDDGPDDVSQSFQSLIEDWLSVEMAQDPLKPGSRTLFPSFDDSLNMLAGLNWAERLILSKFPEDDPHREFLVILVNEIDAALRQLMDAINADEEAS
jgi:hypothetical protein